VSGVFSWRNMHRSSISLPLEGGLDWSPTARVQRGESATARCASTGDHLVCPLLPLLDDHLNAAVLGTSCIRVVAGNRVTVAVACGR